MLRETKYIKADKKYFFWKYFYTTWLTNYSICGLSSAGILRNVWW